MRKSRLSLHKQGRLVEHFVSGTTARCAASLIGVNKSTGAYYFHRLREIIALQLELESHEVFSGEIEVDESYFGGRRKGKRGRGAAGNPLRKRLRGESACIWAIKAWWQGLHKDYTRCNICDFNANYST